MLRVWSVDDQNIQLRWSPPLMETGSMSIVAIPIVAIPIVAIPIVAVPITEGRSSQSAMASIVAAR